MRRRRFLEASAAGLLAPAAIAAPADGGAVLTRPIARSGERVPALGLGTWISFNIGARDAAGLARRRQVLERFFAGGGRLIDSSPMYGSAEEALGRLLPGLPCAQALFSATKVWTPLGAYGPTQMARSLALWGLPRVDLMQVHNLLNWEDHLKTLRAWQAEGRVRLIGVTTSHGNKHDTLRQVLEQQPLDVLQITYNPTDRRAEALLQLAADRSVAVIVNRPFDGGAVLERLLGAPLPPIAGDLGCDAWAPLLLKWELAHPAVSCVIPATSDPEHMTQNLQALRGPLPDARQREALTRAIERALG